MVIGELQAMNKRVCQLIFAFFSFLFGLAAAAEPVAMVTDVRGLATLEGAKPVPLTLLHYFDAPSTVKLGPGATLSVTYFANPVQYNFKGPAVLTIDATAPKVSEGAAPDMRRVGPERSIDGGLTKDQWRRLQQATVVMRSARLGFSVISPNGTTILSPRAELSWTPAAGAQSYRVAVSNESDAPVATWTSTATSTVIPESARLLSGKTYRWKVDAVDAAQPLSASGTFAIAAPDLQQRFAQLRPADTHDRAANVYFASLLELEGFSLDAKAEWKRLARQYPDERAFQRRAAP